MTRQHRAAQCGFTQGFQSFAALRAHTGSLLGYCHWMNPSREV
ncbi:hypothetical protein GLA29479_4460 [Lysobacter antibioticus]|nr:hypothetical protein GLA29479_4460 [Lysobacter antibioticus]